VSCLMNKKIEDSSNKELLKKYNTLFEHLSQAPKSKLLLVRLGNVCLGLERSKEALIFYKRAIRFGLNPEDIEKKLKDNFTRRELEDIEFPVKILPFWQKLGAVAKYPFNMQGYILIFVGGFALTFFSFIFFIIGGMISVISDTSKIRIFAHGIMPLYLLCMSMYILAYMVKILRITSTGEEEFPDWPEFSDFWGAIIRPAFHVITTAAVSYFPAILVIIFVAPSSFGSTLLLLFCFFVGSLYFPMAIIAVVKQDYFWVCLNFSLIFRSIWKIRKHYLFSLVALWFFCVVSTILYIISVRSRIPLIGVSIFWAISIYFTLVEGHILGNIFYINRRILNWLEQESRR